MKPTTTIPAFVVKTPGNHERAREILDSLEHVTSENLEDHGKGLFAITNLTMGEAFKTMMPIWLGLSLTNSISFGAYKSLAEALRANRPQSANTDSSNSSANSSNSLLSLDQFMADNPQFLVADPDEIIFTNPDVTDSEWQIATASPEYQAAFKYRHMDMRQTLPQDELNRIWAAYAAKFPNVSAHDPKWAD
jgi:hypothetical protein